MTTVNAVAVGSFLDAEIGHGTDGVEITGL